MKTLKDIQYLQGVKVLVRADFNVPVASGKVVDDYRIRMTVPTIDFLKSKGAKVILMSNLEAADGENPTLKPIAENLGGHLGQPVLFIRDYKQVNAVVESEMKNGDCALLENLRFNDGEKKNDPKFAEELASLGDIYVNDAFSVCHRAHASVVGVPKFLPSYAGLRLEKEITNLSKAFNPPHPFLFILGGAKFETKLPLLSKFIDIADRVFVGGALASDFFKAKGYELGISLLSKGDIDLKPFLGSSKVILPEDIVDQKNEVKAPDSLSKQDDTMDCGPMTVEQLKKEVDAAKFILWNGPLGKYEEGYTVPTQALAGFIGEATARGAVTMVGGGDTLAAIESLGIQDKFTFVSTGGGAMLDFLAEGTLPGIQALEESKA